MKLHKYCITLKNNWRRSQTHKMSWSSFQQPQHITKTLKNVIYTLSKGKSSVLPLSLMCLHPIWSGRAEACSRWPRPHSLGSIIDQDSRQCNGNRWLLKVQNKNSILWMAPCTSRNSSKCKMQVSFKNYQRHTVVCKKSCILHGRKWFIRSTNCNQLHLHHRHYHRTSLIHTVSHRVKWEGVKAYWLKRNGTWYIITGGE